MEHTEHTSHSSSQKEDHGHGEAEPIIVRKMAVHEKLAQEMKKSGVDCEEFPLGSHKLEHEENFYSHSFALSSRLVTNKGVVRVTGKNIDYVQVLQRN